MPVKGYRATHCKRGHEFTEENTLWQDRPNRPNPQRTCRQCLLDDSRRRRGSRLTGPSLKLVQQEKLRVQHETGKKRCGRCHADKPLSRFKAHEKTYDGLYGWCRACCSERHHELDTPERRAQAAARVRDLYHGLSDGQYDRMLEAQGGGCAICHRAECRTGRALAVDHDHKTGTIRALLCAECNGAIGMLGDSPERCRIAAEYLERHAS